MRKGCADLLMVADFSFPTYKSSNVTGNSMSMLRPRLSFYRQHEMVRVRACERVWVGGGGLR